MKTYSYTLQQAKSGECPFPEDISDDLWVVYHGTSNHVEEKIEKHGFMWQSELYSKSEVSKVIEIFDRLHWVGTDMGGLVVLATYTQYDFERGDSEGTKPIYFAETPFRGMLYASLDWAGGETTRALRHAFRDLDRYLNSEEFRRKEMWKSWRRLSERVICNLPNRLKVHSEDDISPKKIRALWKYFARLGLRIGTGPESGIKPVVFSEDWLRKKLTTLKHVRERCDCLIKSYKYGIVYAVKFSESDIPFLAYSGSSGFMTNKTIPPDRIDSKVRIYPNVYYEFRKNNNLLGKNGLSRVHAVLGNELINCLEKKGQAR